MTGKKLSLNAFGKHGAIINNPTWIIWAVSHNGKKSERYGDYAPIPSTTDMDFAIEWVFGGWKHTRGDAQFKGYVLYQSHIPSKRLFRHVYKAKGEDALQEKKGTRWIYVP
jgi:hypothetical protein